MIFGLSGNELGLFLAGLMAGSYPLAFIAGSFYQKYKTQKGESVE